VVALQSVAMGRTIAKPHQLATIAHRYRRGANVAMRRSQVATSWVSGADGSGFGLANLPYGKFSTAESAPRLGVRIGDFVFDLREAEEEGLVAPECAADSLNPLMAAGSERWAEVRTAIVDLLGDGSYQRIVEPMLVPLSDVDLYLPFVVADWVDFYSSEQHAVNLGTMFRPDSEPLLPNWKHIPIGYHGRAGTVVVSGTDVTRPRGQRRGDDGPVFGPSVRLDIELEMGFVVGPSTSLGETVSIGDVGEYVFGLCLVNDWSARDIQAWEYQPLGPFLGKSFATSAAAWVTPMAALEPHRTDPPRQDPEPLPYLQTDRPWAFDIDLEVVLGTQAMRQAGLEPVSVAHGNFSGMYWTIAQQLAHLTVNGAALRTGDLCGSGTISGDTAGSYGSLLELSWNGVRPIELPDGSVRAFLEDGDEVVLRGSAGTGADRIQMGSVVGRIVGSHLVDD